MQTENTIAIRLRAYDFRLLDRAVKEIRATVLQTGAKVVGPIPMPTCTKKFTVNRGPHVDKKSREQFEMNVHVRLLRVKEWSRATVDALMSLELSSGVDVELQS
ncbi:MAG: 30S ribosomal protein S10 [Alphaproteobacteria bacterium]|nr:30S ribosomal protein S10 [Alphaproteobacteria bacterium]